MGNKWVISLEEMEFFAYHGVHEGERKQGNRFYVSVRVEMDTTSFNPQDDNLQSTLDYSLVYNTCKTAMDKSSYLLETLAIQIKDAIFELDALITMVNVEIKKANPPLGGLVKFATVSVSAERTTPEN